MLGTVRKNIFFQSSTTALCSEDIIKIHRQEGT